jgi:hypothetical protein
MTVDCIRRAWLTLGALTMPLEDEAAGYYCTQLDLGYPTVRDVVDNRPDQHGVTDRTQFFGSRVISANIVAQSPAASSVDEVAASFAPFMDPSARPVLHYVLERPDATEKVLTVRASAYAWPLVGGKRRDIQLQWVASDPVSFASLEQVATAWSGPSVGGGRTYPLTFNRTYPGGGGAPANGVIVSEGDVAVMPYVRIYGPITGGEVVFVAAPVPPSGSTFRLPLLGTNRIDAGHFIGIDTHAHTALLDDDPAQPMLNQLDWTRLRWPVLPVAPYETTMSITGTNTTGISQAQATWKDRYLA